MLALLLLVPFQEPSLDAVVAKLNQSLKAAKTLSLTAEITSKGAQQTFRIKAMRPNFYRVEGVDSDFYSDGQASWLFYKKLNTYLPFGDIQGGMHVPLAAGFSKFSPPPAYKDDYKRVEKTAFRGKEAYALISEPAKLPNMSVKLFVDPKTYLPIAVEQKINDDVQTTVYTNVKTDLEMSPVDFVWTPPADAKRDGLGATASLDLLKPGEKAPDFRVPALDGKTKTLAEMLKGKKALLVNFWFINCGYCLLEMPHLDKLYKKLKGKGLEMYVVNDVDPADQIKRFSKKPAYSFPIGVDSAKAMATAYKVAGKGHPVTYLIDADGNVAHVQVGFSEEKGLRDIEAALARLGVN